jgi:hypothetical protein
MREEKLREYFLGNVLTNELADDVSGSVVQVDDVVANVHITDMPRSFLLTRLHVIHLCDDFLNQTLSSEALSTVAFALLASDTFEWDDDVTSEVLSDRSAPEINYELNAETISMHRNWLRGFSEPPHRGLTQSAGSTDRLVLMRIKTSS